MQPFVTSNIIGATTMEQLRENIESVDINLSDEIIEEINQVHENLILHHKITISKSVLLLQS